ncbi:MAG: response regulator transcription factor [Tissierellia bacterium]|nr:response regulator transcription factor [Tissierellia bacterium]
MLRIGICDDLADARFTLSVSIERIAERLNIETAIYEFSSGDRLLKWFENHENEVDLLFLDIEMPGLDGMATAKSLRQENSFIQIVFVTSHPTYVFDGYSVGAMGYLMKPAKENEVEEIMTRAIKSIRKSEEDVYIIKNIDGMYRVPKSSILYFTSDKRLVICITESRVYEFYGKLSDVEDELGSPFVRIHQRYLVNSKYVDQISGDSVYIKSEELPISRSNKEKALLELSKSLLE